jgi:hypothetical protein
MLDRTEPYYVYDITEAIEVIPETVGQQIGRLDINKKEIYSGDIVRNDYGDGTGVVKFVDGAFVNPWGQKWDGIEVISNHETGK